MRVNYFLISRVLKKLCSEKLDRSSKSSQFVLHEFKRQGQLNMLLQTAWLFLYLLPLAALSHSTPLGNARPAVRVAAAPLPPSQDPWYTPIPGYQSESPGTMLRIRVAPGNLTQIIGGNCSGSFQVLYRTTDANTQPSWAVTTVLLPHVASNTASANRSALVSYQIPYDSADVDASPSYALHFNGTDISEIQGALGLGWYVSVPDYEGPLASFAAGLQSGYATLDSVRVLLSLELEPLGLSRNPIYALWGYSGGALASEWAAELQAQYAPELNFVGAALGGLPVNASSTLDAVNEGPFVGLIPSATLGMTNQFPSAYNYLLSRLKPTGPYNATTFLAAKNDTFAESDVAFAGQNIYDYFIGGRADIQDSPILKKILNNQGVIGYHGIPQMPLFVYKAIRDEVSPIADTDALVSKYCAVGVSIHYERNTIGGHAADQQNGEAHAYQYLAAWLNGTSPIQGCVITNTTIAVDPSPL